MKSAYLLQHSYCWNDVEETKIIGVYSTRERAEKVVECYKFKPGFSDYKDEFVIDEYIVDDNHWEDGFESIH